RRGRDARVQLAATGVGKARISLGSKQVESDPFGSAGGRFKTGAVVTGTVSEVNDGGVELQLAEGITGFIRKTDLSRERSEQRPERYAVGERVDAKISSIDRKTRKISLSIKQLQIEEEKQAMAEYGNTDSGASLGDILGAALKQQQQQRGGGDEK